jgi:hypothetical protein
VNKVRESWARALVVIKAAPTWLTMVATVVTIVSTSVGIPVVASVGASIAAALTTAVLIIRRVTPVLPDERGILPPAA